MTGYRDSSKRLRELIDLICNDQAGESDFAELQERLLADPKARRVYVEAMELQASLRKSRVPAMRAPESLEPRPIRVREGSKGEQDRDVDRFDSGTPTGGAGSRGGRGRRGLLVRIRVAVAALVVAATALGLWRIAVPDRPKPKPIAVVEWTEGARWSEPTSPDLAVGSPLSAGQSLRLHEGRARIRFGDDARLTLDGPAIIELDSAMRVRVLRGKVTARVGPRSKGFTVETPQAEVVDLGTEFGVEIDRSGSTSVVVFQGVVDLSYEVASSSPHSLWQANLKQGEALRLDPAGILSRIVSIERSPGDNRWTTANNASPDAVIRSVRDNIRGLGSNKYYQIVRRGLTDDELAYVDRSYRWENIPELLRGADYIMPFLDDKNIEQLNITVELACAATLYILFDDRGPRPSWLLKQFTDTGVDLELFEESLGKRKSFSAWKRDVDPNELITLGPVGLMVARNPIGTSAKQTMYGIAAVPRPRIGDPPGALGIRRKDSVNRTTWWGLGTIANGAGPSFFRAPPPGTHSVLRIGSGPESSGPEGRKQGRMTMRSDQGPVLTRRAVLVAGLSAAGALAVGRHATSLAAPGATPAGGPYGPFKMGLQSYSLRGIGPGGKPDLDSALAATKELGLHYWESYPAHIPTTSDPAVLGGIKKKLEDAGVTVLGYGVVRFTNDADAGKKVLDFARKMGIEYLSADPDPASFDTLDKLVEEYGVSLGIHNHGPGHRWAKIDTIAAAIKDHNPRIGCCVDTGHFLRSREDPVRAVEVFGPRVYGVHLKDVKDATKFTILGEGDLRTTDLLKALARLNYRYGVNLEYEENPKAPLDDIRACLKATREAVAAL